MSDQDYSPPRVWRWETGSGGKAFNISSKPPATIEWGQGLARDCKELCVTGHWLTLVSDHRSGSRTG